jgi:hypothetical protein
MLICGDECTVDVQRKELLLISADRGGHCRCDDCGLQIIRRVDRDGPAPNEELIVNILWCERVKGKPRIASKICTLG